MIYFSCVLNIIHKIDVTWHMWTVYVIISMWFNIKKEIWKNEERADWLSVLAGSHRHGQVGVCMQLETTIKALHSKSRLWNIEGLLLMESRRTTGSRGQVISLHCDSILDNYLSKDLPNLPYNSRKGGGRDVSDRVKSIICSYEV